MDFQTICALSSPVGTGALHVIRVSGPEAVMIVGRLFRRANVASKKKAAVLTAPVNGLAKVKPGKVRYGMLLDPKTGEVLDEVVVSVFKAPHSFTGEDTVEISCHGGMYIVRRILMSLLENGCRMAEKGEFSKRAFLNGKMDLTEAEAVMDMIAAKTRYSLKAATQQLGGVLKDAVEEIREDLIHVLSDMEVNIDYPEYDDIPEITDEMIQEKADEAIKKTERLLATSSAGKLMKNGIKTCLIGSPNVGKSSFLNFLLKEERAIVTEIPGTTRDVIEESVDLDGIELCLVDTAGVRETENVIERIGVERSLREAKEADLVLFLLDASKDVTPEEKDLYQAIAGKPHLILINKEDMLEDDASKDALLQKVKDELCPGETVTPYLISVKTGSGIDEVMQAVKDLFFEEGILETDGPLVTNLRQEEALIRAKEALLRVKEAYGMPQDLLTIDLREAADAFSELLGKSTQEDVITEIFSRFCLGK